MENCPLSTDTYQVTNCFKNGIPDTKDPVSDVAKIKVLMACKTTQISLHEVQTIVHLKIDYSSVIQFREGKAIDVTYWL